MYIHNACPYQEIKIDIYYHIVATRVHIKRNSTVSVATIYITGETAICNDEIKILTELPKPLLLLRDFDAQQQHKNQIKANLRNSN